MDSNWVKGKFNTFPIEATEDTPKKEKSGPE